MLIRGRQFERWARVIFCLKIHPAIFRPFLFPPKELVAGFNLDSLAHDVVPYSTLERDSTHREPWHRDSGPWWMLLWRVRAKPLGVGRCSDGSSCCWVFCGNVGFFVVYWFLREKLWDFLRICPTWHPSIPHKNTFAEGGYLRLHTTTITIHTQKRDGSVFKTSHHDEFWEKWVKQLWDSA